jgi:ABC-2 type transport system ATP-binding protein
MEAGIRVQSLKKIFDGTVALDDISFEIEHGELFGILGPDGSGKTTLCRILAGIMKPSGGTVRVGSYDATEEAEKMKNFTGYMPHNYGLYGDLTVEENIHFYADIFRVPPKARRERMDRVLTLTGMAPFTKRRSQFLSGGMKQKLQLSCALIHTPTYLILDEPTFGVDPVSRREFWKLLLELLAEGLTILVSTSYMDEAQRCNRVALLHNGRIIHQGEPDEIIALIPGTMAELFTPETIDAAKILAPLPWVRSVTTYGDRIHLLLREKVDQNMMMRFLQQENIQVTGAGIISPSLEDAFIYMIEEESRNVG